MTTKRIRKLATVAATAALALQLFAGTSLAAKPNATSSGQSFDFAGSGWAGFSTTYNFLDNNIPKLFVELDVKGASSIGFVGATRNGNAVNACSKSGLVVKCQFNSVKNGETFALGVGAVPSADDVTAVAEWSTTGFVPGGNNSHGDAWDICVAGNIDCRVATAAQEFGYAAGTFYLVASRGSDQSGNFAAGFGNTSLATNQVVDKKTNPQAARLEGLPAGVFSDVDDQAILDTTTGFYIVKLHVDNGADHNFQLIIVYPNGTGTPTAYQHLDEAGTVIATYTACAKGDTTECFTWDPRKNTATINLPHNGGVRRA